MTDCILRTGDKLPPMARTMDLRPGSLDMDERTVDVVFSTESDEVSRSFGREILGHADGEVNLGRMNHGAPFLFDHSAADQRGVVLQGTAKLADGRGYATVKLSRSKSGEELLQDIADGIRTCISVGYTVTEIEHLGRHDSGEEMYRVTGWTPHEVSSVALPADPDAGVRSSGDWLKRGENFCKRIKVKQQSNQQRQMPEDTNNEPAEAPAVEAAEPQVAPAIDTSALREATEAAKAEAIEAVREASKLERERESEIRSIAKDANIDAKEIDKAIDSDLTVDQFRAQAFDKLAHANPPVIVAEATPEVVATPAPSKGTRASTQENWGKRAIELLGSKANGQQQRSVVVVNDEGRNYIDSPDQVFSRAMTGAPTLATVTAANLDDDGGDVIQEAAQFGPELFAMPVDIIPGELTNVSVVSDPITSAYRAPNTGNASKAATIINRPFETKLIEQLIIADERGVIGAADDPGRVLRANAVAVTQGVFATVGFNSWYGGTAQANVDTEAADGFISQISHEVDAAGVTAPTSVFVCAQQVGECDHVYSRLGGEGFTFGTWESETVYDDAQAPLKGLVNSIAARFAPRLANLNRMVRIKGVGTDAPLTATMLYQAFEVLEGLGMVANHIYMNPRSRYQLRDDLVTNSSAATKGYASPPMDFDGVPITATTNIVSAETV